VRREEFQCIDRGRRTCRPDVRIANHGMALRAFAIFEFNVFLRHIVKKKFAGVTIENVIGSEDDHEVFSLAITLTGDHNMW